MGFALFLVLGFIRFRVFPRVIVSLNRAPRVIASTNSRRFARQPGGTGFASIADGYPHRDARAARTGPAGPAWIVCHPHAGTRHSAAQGLLCEALGHGGPIRQRAGGYPWALLAPIPSASSLPPGPRCGRRPERGRSFLRRVEFTC